MIQPAVIRNISGPLPPPRRLAINVPASPASAANQPISSYRCRVSRVRASRRHQDQRYDEPPRHRRTNRRTGQQVRQGCRPARLPRSVGRRPPARAVTDAAPARSSRAAPACRPRTTENTSCRPCRRQPRPSRAPTTSVMPTSRPSCRGEGEQDGLADPGEPSGSPTALDDHPSTPRDRVHGSTEQRQRDRRHHGPEPSLRDRTVRENRQPVRRCAPRAGDPVDDEGPQQSPSGQRCKGNRAEQQHVRRAGRAEGDRRKRPELSQPGRWCHAGRCRGRRMPQRAETFVRRQQQGGTQYAAADQTAGGHERTDGKENPRHQERPADQLPAPARLVLRDARRALGPAGRS